MRLFVALDITPEIRLRLEHYCEQLRREYGELTDARWTRVEGLHITLKFVGEYPEAELPKLKKALAAVKSPTFDVSFRGIGFFPTPRSPRVLFAEVAAGLELPELARRVEAACAKAGV